jgi:uncharacterized protein YggE
MSRIGLVIGTIGLVLLVVVLAVQLLVAVPSAGRSGVQQEPTGITVMAEGKASAEPDLATINIGVENRAAEAQEAARENNEQMTAVMAALLEMAIPSEDVQTVNYSIQAEIDWENEEHRVIGYVVNNSVLVKLRDMDKVGDVIDAVTEAGANNVYGIQFTFDDPSSLREQARADAMAEALKKAEALAQLAGVNLGTPRYISESFTETPFYYSEQMYASQAGMGGGGEAPVSPGQREVFVQVQVTYDIR